MKGRPRKRNGDTRIEVRDARVTNWSWFENAAMDRYAKEIGPYAWMVYTYLIRRADKNSQCFPSYKTAAKDLGISRTSVYKAVIVLEEKGLIHVEERTDEESGDPTSHLYTVLGVSPNEPGPSPNESRPVIEQAAVYHDVNPNNPHVNKIQEQEEGSPPRSSQSESSISRAMPPEPNDPRLWQLWHAALDRATLSPQRQQQVRAMVPLSWLDGVLTLYAPADLARRKALAAELLSRLAPVAPVPLVEVRLVNGQ